MKPEAFILSRREAPLLPPFQDRGPAGPPAPARGAERAGKTSRVCFLYIAQAHQVPHNISAAVELARGCPDLEVHVAATTTESIAYAREIVTRMGGAPIHWTLLGPAWLRAAHAPGDTPLKLPMLIANLSRLAGFDVLVTPERTTASVRLMGLKQVKLVYTQHGAGDRAGPFEPRLKAFDLVFAAGRKQRDRMVGEGLVSPSACAIVGYPKFDVVDATYSPPARLFAEDRPIVLYNPHFDRTLSSWPDWGADVLQAFADQRDYNLIFAPHLRLFGTGSASKALAAFRDHPGIHIDLGARACLDMTYTEMADIYLGDVSSQVYEFIRRPRPCVFLNAHGANWRGVESYRHWQFGPVLDSVEGLTGAIDDAVRAQGDYVPAQVENFRYTFDDDGRTASRRAAEAIAVLSGTTLQDAGADAVAGRRLREAAGA